MVKEGYAEVYKVKPPYGFDPAPYVKVEKVAKKANRGMWSQGDKYVSPREWREMQKGKDGQ